MYNLPIAPIGKITQAFEIVKDFICIFFSFNTYFLCWFREHLLCYDHSQFLLSKCIVIMVNKEVTTRFNNVPYMPYLATFFSFLIIMRAYYCITTFLKREFLF